MAQCDLGYEHPDPAAEAAPVVIEADPGPNENDVRIAEIEAAAGIERERIWTEQQELALAAENESLRGELRGIRETLATLVPPVPEPEPVPEPAPVIVAAADDGGTPPPPATDTKNVKKEGGGGWWDAYG